MSFWKRLVERVRLGLFLTASTTCWALNGPAASRRKNGTPSRPTAPDLGTDQWGRMVMMSLEELEELAPKEIVEFARSCAESPPPARKNAATSSGPAMAEKLVYEDLDRLRAAMGTPLAQGGVQFWDPQCDMPLDDMVEEAIRQMTPPVYLRWLCSTYKIDINPVPETEYACLRAARKAVRNIPDFTGERFIQ